MEEKDSYGLWVLKWKHLVETAVLSLIGPKTLAFSDKPG